MQSCDVAVIGGGLVGCSSAYYLSASGTRVIVVERGQINQGASGQNAGSLHFQLEHRLIEHRKKLARQLEHYVALTRLAIDHWENLETELGCSVDVAMDGGFMVAETDGEIRALREKSKIEESHGLTVSLLDRGEILDLAPYLSESVKAASFCPDEGHCNPRLLTPAYARGARANRAQILTETEVTGIRPSGRKWTINLRRKQPGNGDDTISADVILNAAGAWAGEVGAIAGIELPLCPVGLIMNVTEKAPPVMHHLIQHAGRKLSMKQVEDGNLLIGGGWPAELQHKDGKWQSRRPALIDTSTVEKNLRTASDIAPLIADLHLIRAWTGITALTPDQLPVLGKAGNTPGFYVAAGGSAFSYGPTYARLMSELILTGSTSFPIAPYAPARFR